MKPQALLKHQQIGPRGYWNATKTFLRSSHVRRGILEEPKAWSSLDTDGTLDWHAFASAGGFDQIGDLLLVVRLTRNIHQGSGDLDDVCGKVQRHVDTVAR